MLVAAGFTDIRPGATVPIAAAPPHAHKPPAADDPDR
jgi:hypothetical protein